MLLRNKENEKNRALLTPENFYANSRIISINIKMKIQSIFESFQKP